MAKGKAKGKVQKAKCKRQKAKRGTGEAGLAR
jgi:hypothetical protein